MGLDSGAELRTANTTDLGSFQFEVVPVGSHKVFAQRLGYVSKGTSVEVVKDTSVDLKIVLEPLCSSCMEIPVEASLFNVESVGGWFQIPYSEAAKVLPAGFAAKPHVLLDSNGQTAEYSFYIQKYKNGTVEGREIQGGYWAFEVLSVTAPNPHAGGTTVSFIPLRMHASDPTLVTLLNQWNLATQYANGTYAATPTAAANQVTAGLKAEAESYQLTIATASSQETLTGGSLSVRFFALQEKTVYNYVDVAISGVQYSLSGAARLDPFSGTAYSPIAPLGEGYIQWGAQAKQVLKFTMAKGAPADLD